MTSLRINLHNSNLFTIRLDAFEVRSLAILIGFSVGSILFMYLGLPVGESVNRLKVWKSVMDRFKKSLFFKSQNVVYWWLVNSS